MMNMIRYLHTKTWETWRNPNVQKIVFQPDTDKLKRIKQKREIVPPMMSRVEKTSGPRYNYLDIQMISDSLYKQVFKNYPKPEFNASLIESCRKTLDKHEMYSKAGEVVNDIDLELPPMLGNNLEEHFLAIGEQQSKPYFEIVEKLMGTLPKRPKFWSFQQGWTRYVPGQNPVSVDYPLEDGIIFDVEVCVKSGKAPTLATAVSREAWYGWVSQELIDGSSKPQSDHQYTESSLIPLESTGKFSDDLLKPKVVIGHNVSYDRARIKEQYWLERTGLRFVDTMSLHVCVSGMTSYQRAVLKSKSEDNEDVSWKALSSLNSLNEVHNLYCGSYIDKETRNLFVEGTIIDIQREFSTVMDYCCNDVIATHNVLLELFPMFKERFPHPVTFAGMLELGTAYLPVNSNWLRYIEESQQTYEDLDIEGKMLLTKRADQACHLLHDDKYKDDIWMWDQDWEVKQFKIKKETAKRAKEMMLKRQVVPKEDVEDLDPLDFKFQYLEDMKDLIYKNQILSGYPSWYKKLCLKHNAPEWTPGPHLISTSMQITPKLLNLTWEGFPLHFIRGLGWGLLVPFNADCDDKTIPLRKLLEKCPLRTIKGQQGEMFDNNIRQLVQENLARKEYYSKVKKDQSDGVYDGSGIWCNTILEDSVFFFKLPHKDGAAYRVGNPLAKDFLNKFSENVLAGDTDGAEQVLAIARKLSYWRNNRDRIKEQMVVWLDEEMNYGSIIPQIVVCGTLTRRAVESTWMTASNAHKERIGSELRAMIQAPKGYKIVGADVDSQELWIASVIGDANHAKMHGATPLGWMTLSGSKSDGTDMHSVTAKAVGISRDHAKVMNYARIYGAGQNFAERLLKQFNPSMSEGEARSKAVKMFNLTKGKRFYQIRPEYLHDFADIPYNKWQAYELAKIHGKHLHEMFFKPKWVDGTESAMFNRLEEIAGNFSPVTTFLNSRLSRALEPKYLPDDKFLPTRINWVVQSGAVDFLHLMLVCMRWIMKDDVRFCLSFHDEIRYIVPDKHKYRAALAMHVTNLLTRAFCSVRLGINDLPSSVAFFSSVEIDDVLRKESKHDCKTPSNPHGLDKGYGIPNGESLNINEAIEKAYNRKRKWFMKAERCREQ